MVSWLARLAAPDRRRLHVWLIAILVGTVTFFGWLGYARTLDPTDLGWIWHEDPFTHTMGWEQFRNAPLLQYPITKNQLYGLEWSSTIVFTDSIPIVALLLRPFSALLPVPFQYLGWWVLLSLILQAYWGARLVMLRSDRLRDAAIAAVFFVTTPVLTERLALQTAVGSHWLILWALYLYFSARDLAPRAWTLLLLLTVSVHAYIFVMVGAIWAAHLVACRLRGLMGRRELALAFATLCIVLAWMHVLGYFMVGGGAAGGTWLSSFDLLGFVAPALGARFGIAPLVYDDPWDGCTYLGAGILLLLIASAVAYAVRRRRAPEAQPISPEVRWLPLVIVLLGLAAFAITNHVTIGNKTLAVLPLPRALRGLYETFRGANRMIWPAYYVVLAATLWLAARAWPRRAVAFVLAAAAAVQAVDLHGTTTLRRAELAGAGITRPLTHPIWTTIAQHYGRLVSVPAKHRQADWPTFAWFAARNRMGSNIGYLSRNNPAARLAGGRAHLEAVATGTYDRSTVYYFPSPVLWTLAQESMGPDDLAMIADGFHLILPGGRAWSNEGAPPPRPGTLLGKEISFASEEGEGLLLDGWSWRESWGTWSVGKEAMLVLPVPPDERVRVTFTWRSIVRPRSPQRVRVHLDQARFEVVFPQTRSTITHTFEVTTSRRLLQVRLEIAEQINRPGTRPIGIGLSAVRVQRASDPIQDDIPDAAHGAPILDTWISFASDAPGRALLHRGWSWGESWGTWSQEPDTVLALPVPPGERLEITFRWLSTAPPGSLQEARGFLDDQAVYAKFPAPGKEQEDAYVVTSKRGWVILRLAIDRPVQAADGRALGVGLISARVRRLDAPK